MKKILMFIVILVIGFTLVGCADKENKVSDASKFIEEYESLNGETTSSGKIYTTLNLEEDNKIKYETSKKIVNIIKKDTGIIYFGFPECPWCRMIVPVLLEVAKENDIDIYYLNIYDFRSTFVIENGKAKLSKEGEKDYYTILDLLDDELEDYNLAGKDGKKISTGEKRLYAPTVVFVKDGEVKGVHVASVDSQTDPYLSLTTEQREELKNIYIDNFNKIK